MGESYLRRGGVSSNDLRARCPGADRPVRSEEEQVRHQFAPARQQGEPRPPAAPASHGGPPLPDLHSVARLSRARIRRLLLDRAAQRRAPDGVRRALGGWRRGFFNSAIATSIALSIWGSRPAMTSAGVCSTAMSGGTPSCSTTQPSSGVQMARFGAVMEAPAASVCGVARGASSHARDDGRWSDRGSVPYCSSKPSRAHRTIRGRFVGGSRESASGVGVYCSVVVMTDWRRHAHVGTIHGADAARPA